MPDQRKDKTLLDGKYEIVAPVGMGGMASVWRAVAHGAAGFSRPVAVKRILPKHRDDDEYVAMFVEEARVGSELVHQNLVQVYDLCGSRDEGYFLVMEWVEGCALGTLARSCVPELPPWQEMCFAVGSALNGLAIAHDRLDVQGNPSPIIHRDVSPGNILINIRGEAKLGDFGLAKADDRELVNPTLPGMVKGKPGYMAPEVLHEAAPNVASDIYAMGVTLWEALTGKRLFGHSAQFDRLKAIVQGDVTPLSEHRDDLPPRLLALLDSALTMEPDQRPGSATDFADELFSALRENGGRYLQARLAERVRTYIG